MTQRERAMALIAAEVASEGCVTPYAVRLYIENRLSARSFRAAVDRGATVAQAAIDRARSHHHGESDR